MLQIIGISLLSGMSTPLGGAIVLLFPHLSTRWLALILGMASGIMITVIIIELMPTAIAAANHRIFLLGGLAGWAFMDLARRLLEWEATAKEVKPANNLFRNMGWFVALAIAIHDLPEGMAIGAGEAVHHDIGLVIALAIAIHNIPEGMGIAAPLQLGGVSKFRIFTTTFFTGLVTPLGTIVSLALVNLSPTFVALSLAFASGAMVYVVAESLLPTSLTQNWVLTLMGGVLGAGIMVAVTR